MTRRGLILITIVVGSAIIWFARVPSLPAGFVDTDAAFTAEDVARGRYLVTAAGCASCHTSDDGPSLAGGLPLATPFGTFYVPNITPDPATGIGTWTLTEFARSMHLGVGPGGKRYFPAFPYTSYTGLTGPDVRVMFAYLRSVAAVRNDVPDHDLPWYLARPAMIGWQRLFFRPGRFEERPDQDATWNRGAYLVGPVGHCGECHTPRNRLGALDRNRTLAGNPHGADGDPVPNITASRENGIGKWTRSALDYFLQEGMLPSGDFSGGAMTKVIENNLAELSDADRAAMVQYLRSVPALD